MKSLIPPALRGLALAGMLAAGAAHAVQDCDINGESVNPANGNTTAGKTGLMRCKDRDSGLVVREQELQAGKFMGLVRYYDKGKVTKEHSVNERGNMEGRAREFAPNGQVVFEAQYANGNYVGLTRGFHENGQPRRATFYEDGREKASAEWNNKGQLQDLRCADRPVLGPALDDRRLCGFAGPSQVELVSGSGELQTRSTWTEGKRTRHETYYRSGKPQMQLEVSPTLRVERRFAEDGVKRREVQFAPSAPPTGSGEPRMYKTLEQEFSERGGLVREQRWAEGGAPLSDVSYYLNGQPKERSEYLKDNGADVRVATTYFDSGKRATEGRYAQKPRSRAGTPVGSHKAFDEQGRTVAESIYDDRGRVSRERVWDENGKLVRDDEVFEDGSRKAFAK